MNGLQAQAAPLPIDSAAEQARLTARSAHIGGLAPNVSLATPSGAHNDDSVVASVSIRQGSYNSREFHQHHDMGCPPTPPTVVPESATFALSAAGFLPRGVVARRRRSTM